MVVIQACATAAMGLRPSSSSNIWRDFGATEAYIVFRLEFSNQQKERLNKLNELKLKAREVNRGVRTNHVAHPKLKQ